MVRAGLDKEIVVRAAISIADSEGLASLSIAKLAAVLGVKAPSLYNHILSLDMVKDDLTRQGMLLLLDITRDAMAGVEARKALEALGHAQRNFARDHPGLWAGAQMPVAGWSKATQKVANVYIGLVLAVLRGYGITDDAAIHSARVIRASLKGFIDLELGGGFGYPEDVDVSFDTLLKNLDSGLRMRKKI
ncbi:TetR/AcrR family transcriptional regulator [Acidisoma silvae]|uniref:WHG domain-containing protein n=1 Tax=Acidisoma silvae TaxID=2802396 RepID=A0A963YVX6_9PROT|nr:TetR-like C-terminal domain-containing protein [Acidisoma silvae]MCB8877916.1 WHG domain-containing protein [Acidisoma silvae]